MQETSVTIRPAEPHEAQALTDLTLRSKAHWGYDEAFMKAVAAELRVTPQVIEEQEVFVLTEHGVPAGFYTLIVEGARAELSMLFIDPPAIGRGYGRALFEHAAREARALGATEMVIDSDPFAEPFYLALGAERIGEAPSGSIPGRMLPQMRLRLG
ncbi:MAG: GNAT family N-acetyltransferase [Actinomycetota bacterium]